MAASGDEVFALLHATAAPHCREEPELIRLDLPTGADGDRVRLSGRADLTAPDAINGFVVTADAVVLRSSRVGLASLTGDDAWEVFTHDGRFVGSEPSVLIHPHPVAWPGAGAAVVQEGSTVLILRAGEPTVLLEGLLSAQGYPGVDGRSLVASGSRLVYAREPYVGGPRSLVAVDVSNTGGLLVDERAWPAAFGTAIPGEYTNWGPDSFAVTLYDPAVGAVVGQHVLGMDLRYGRALPPRPATASRTPLPAVVPEDPRGPRQRRFWRHGWTSSRWTLIEGVSQAEIWTSPRFDTTFVGFDGVSWVDFGVADELVGVRSHDPRGIVRFDADGTELPPHPDALDFSAPNASMQALLPLGNFGYAVRMFAHDSVYFLDEELRLVASVLPAVPFSRFVPGAALPDGGFASVTTDGADVVLGRVYSDGRPPDTTRLTAALSGNPEDYYATVFGLEAGPQGELALTGRLLDWRSGDRFQNTAVVAADGSVALNDCAACPYADLVARFSPDGHLLLVEPDGAFDVLERSGAASYVVRERGRLGLSPEDAFDDAAYTSDGRLLASYTRDRCGPDPRAVVAEVAGTELRELTVAPSESVATSLRVHPTRGLLQGVVFDMAMRAVVFQSATSDAPVPTASERSLFAHSPLCDRLRFTLAGQQALGNDPVVRLLDLTGRLAHAGTPRLIGDGEFTLDVPPGLPPGAYGLQVGQQAALVVRQ